MSVSTLLDQVNTSDEQLEARLSTMLQSDCRTLLLEKGVSESWGSTLPSPPLDQRYTSH